MKYLYMNLGFSVSFPKRLFLNLGANKTNLILCFFLKTCTGDYIVITLFKIVSMQTKIIQIGNSKGLRLSKTILEKYQIGDTVNLRMEENCIIIEAISTPRNNWVKSFKEMHKNGHDELLIEDIFEEETNWE
jgi:antitoxin MazE